MNGKLDDLKVLVEAVVGLLSWTDSEAFGGASWAELPEGGEVSVLVDPPEGTPQVKGLGVEWARPLSIVATDLEAAWPAMDKIDIGPLGASITGDLTYDEWQHQIEALFRFNKALPWIIGDLMNYGEAAYGEQWAQVLSVAQILDYSPNTVQQWKSVASRIPLSERQEDVSWGCWRYLAGKTPAERALGLEAYAGGLNTEEVKELLSGDDEPQVVKHPPCPVCGGETTGSRCKECAAGYSAVAWHYADTSPLERARRQPEVIALVKAFQHLFEIAEDATSYVPESAVNTDWASIYDDREALKPFDEEMSQ